MADVSAPAWLGQRLIGVGFRRWKQAHLRPLLSLQPGRVVFVPDAARAAGLQPSAADALVASGGIDPLRTVWLRLHEAQGIHAV